MNNIKRNIGFITFCVWPVLGFKRGLNSYDYNFSNNKLYKHHEKAKHPFYLDKLAWGITGTVMYLMPPFCLIVAYKEMYRLEVNVRGLENEKKTDYYNEVL
jgi:hypothetical protein